jgi:hypothetical protein
MTIMKEISISLFILLLASVTAYSQKIQSGVYDNALLIAVNSSSNQLTGYYENYTGWDEESNSPRFSCVFYIEGEITDSKFSITTYYPNYSETILGYIEINSDSSINIKLAEEHGGCWNVEHFANEPNKFSIEENKDWIAIKFVKSDKAYFYNEKSEDKKRKAYIIKNDFVLIKKIEGDWAYGVYEGKTITKGWIKLSDLN